MTDEKMIEMYFQKAASLVGLGKKTALNFDIDGVRYHGRHMHKVKISEGEVSFTYNEKEIVVDISKIANVRRLRTRKFLFTVKGSKEVKQEIKKETKKAKKKAKKEEV